VSVSRTRAGNPDLVDRRHVLRCAALCGAAPLLVACGSDEGTPGGAATESSGPAGEALVPTADVPVGSGVVLDDVIVAQPTEGEFVAFTTVCTHQGAKVSTVSTDGVMTCSLHGSQFSIEGGENLRGPNGDPAGSVADLPTVAVAVEGDQVVRA
jgi:nitrite reductase/ring-hydroxylating ferredoxin subunit